MKELICTCGLKIKNPFFEATTELEFIHTNTKSFYRTEDYTLVNFQKSSYIVYNDMHYHYMCETKELITKEKLEYYICIKSGIKLQSNPNLRKYLEDLEWKCY